jgi:hypothetical protein
VLASLSAVEKDVIILARASPDLLIFTAFAYGSTAQSDEFPVKPSALIFNAHRPCSTRRGFVQPGFK